MTATETVAVIVSAAGLVALVVVVWLLRGDVRQVERTLVTTVHQALDEQDRRLESRGDLVNQLVQHAIAVRRDMVDMARQLEAMGGRVDALERAPWWPPEPTDEQMAMLDWALGAEAAAAGLDLGELDELLLAEGPPPAIREAYLEHRTVPVREVAAEATPIHDALHRKTGEQPQVTGTGWSV